MTLQLITEKLYGPDWHAQDLDDFQQFLEKLPRERFKIFRGQDSKRPLLPYISRRRSKHGSFLDMEMKIFELFKKEASSWVESPPRNDWDWLALAQHQSLATRLLDWSRDPLIALWFALRTTPSDCKPAPEVWMFMPEKRDIINGKESSDPFKGKRTKVFLPSKKFPRIQVQKGAFTVFKYIRNKLRTKVSFSLTSALCLAYSPKIWSFARGAWKIPRHHGAECMFGLPSQRSKPFPSF
jgi:hypothetical protein